MWTQTTRQQHRRPVTRYQTDLTDAEWRVIAPHLPKPCSTGRPRAWPMREIVNGIFYVMGLAARGGCCRRTCHDGGRFTAGSPPGGTPGVLKWINHALVMADREQVGRAASPTAAIIDSQSAKTTEAGGPRGYEAGKDQRRRHGPAADPRQTSSGDEHAEHFTQTFDNLGHEIVLHRKVAELCGRFAVFIQRPLLEVTLRGDAPFFIS